MTGSTLGIGCDILVEKVFYLVTIGKLFCFGSTLRYFFLIVIESFERLEKIIWFLFIYSNLSYFN